MTPKERNLVKGALRRVFSRSELRQQAIAASRIQHSDPERPRVKKWSMCPLCEKPTPSYLMQVDHVEPIVPVNKTLEEMSWDEVVKRIWCDAGNLLAVCIPCHLLKSKQERIMRASYKKEKKNGK